MNSSPNDVTRASLVHKKLELGNKRQQRSQANWHENGEKCSEYFCKLEKKICIKKTITELIDENGQHITDPSEILLEQQNFYKTLYSSGNINDYDESFFNHDIKLTEDQKALCEGNLTFMECADCGVITIYDKWKKSWI